MGALRGFCLHAQPNVSARTLESVWNRNAHGSLLAEPGDHPCPRLACPVARPRGIAARMAGPRRHHGARTHQEILGRTAVRISRSPRIAAASIAPYQLRALA